MKSIYAKMLSILRVWFVFPTTLLSISNVIYKPDAFLIIWLDYQKFTHKIWLKMLIFISKTQIYFHVVLNI